ncbi:MAG: hypothetical protein DSY74_04915 [Actinobacteria bacterium]|nr:MAG: hypothetical protein DSY74_04915 [Actinomycetota bacterium]
MLSEARPDHKTDHAAIRHVAGKLGVNPETLRLWKKRLDVDEGREPGGLTPFPRSGGSESRPVAPWLRAGRLVRSCRTVGSVTPRSRSFASSVRPTGCSPMARMSRRCVGSSGCPSRRTTGGVTSSAALKPTTRSA